MRALTLNQAQRCETAHSGRCRCRCRGQLHGAGRNLSEAFFLSLPEDDPHRATEPRAKQPKPAKTRPQMSLFEGGQA
jgi:hypothetical protein